MLDTLADRVVQWHNRNPLAHRITAAQVQSIGYVALPFRGAAPTGPAEAAAPPEAAALAAAAEAAPAGGTLRERAMARARQPGAMEPPPPPAAAARAAQAGKVASAQAVDEPAFAEDFLAPVPSARVARWALQHALGLDADPRDAPVRHIEASGDGPLRQLYALTAQIELDSRRSRVLVGPGEPAPVLGRRLLSRPRLAGAAGTAVMLPALGVAALLWLGSPVKIAAPAARAAASAAGKVVTPVPPPQPFGTGALTLVPPRPQLAAADASASAAASAQAAASPVHLTPEGRPVDVEPQLGKVELPGLGLPRGARSTAQRAQAPSAASMPSPAPGKEPPQSAARPPAVPQPPSPRLPEPAPPALPATATTAAAPTQAASVPLAPQRGSFGVSTRLLRTRAESEQVMQAMQALLETLGARDARVDIVPHGDDWRVIGWPFARREDADRARALLASRGMRVEVLVF